MRGVRRCVGCPAGRGLSGNPPRASGAGAPSRAGQTFGPGKVGSRGRCRGAATSVAVAPRRRRHASRGRKCRAQGAGVLLGGSAGRCSARSLWAPPGCEGVLKASQPGPREGATAKASAEGFECATAGSAGVSDGACLGQAIGRTPAKRPRVRRGVSRRQVVGARCIDQGLAGPVPYSTSVAAAPRARRGWGAAPRRVGEATRAPAAGPGRAGGGARAARPHERREGQCATAPAAVARRR
jgi:hypothetical protein